MTSGLLHLPQARDQRQQLDSSTVNPKPGRDKADYGTSQEKGRMIRKDSSYTLASCLLNVISVFQKCVTNEAMHRVNGIDSTEHRKCLPFGINLNLFIHSVDNTLLVVIYCAP